MNIYFLNAIDIVLYQLIKGLKKTVLTVEDKSTAIKKDTNKIGNERRHNFYLKVFILEFGGSTLVEK